MPYFHFFFFIFRDLTNQSLLTPVFEEFCPKYAKKNNEKQYKTKQNKKKQKLVYEKYLSHIAKMIDLKLRDEIQNIYLFIYLFAHTLRFFQ